MKQQKAFSIHWHSCARTSTPKARFVLVGVSHEGRLLTICYALPDEETIRLISGREATAREKRQYAEGI